MIDAGKRETAHASVTPIAPIGPLAIAATTLGNAAKLEVASALSLFHALGALQHAVGLGSLYREPVSLNDARKARVLHALCAVVTWPIVDTRHNLVTAVKLASHQRQGQVADPRQDTRTQAEAPPGP